MKRLVAAAVVMAASVGPAAAWGFVAHRIIAENAAAAAPPGMSIFYKAATERVSAASIEPDSVLKDRDQEREKRRHYIDLDELSRPPFPDLPFDEEKARALYGDERVDGAGTLPWRIMTMLGQLREAFEKKDWEKVVVRSGWLSHYVADAYQPLHTTKNFDGQESCNAGVHAAFETDMIDIGKTRYRASTALSGSFAPEVIREPRRFIFIEIIASYDLVDDVLKADTAALAAVKKQRRDYYEELEQRLGVIARQQMSRATATTLNLWYTAWFEAGRPQLPATVPPPAVRADRP